MSRWENRIVGEGEEAPDQLLANPRNWRVHSALQQESMGAILDRVGWVQRVLVNKRSGHVLDGHMRVAMAISAGEPSVPVEYVDLDEDEEAVALATFDTVGAMANPDADALSSLLADASRAAGDNGSLRSFLGMVAAASGAGAEGFKEVTKDIADGVEFIQCPACGEKFPKQK